MNSSLSPSEIYQEIGGYMWDNLPASGWEEARLYIEINGNGVRLTGYADEGRHFQTPFDAEVARCILELQNITASPKGIWAKAVYKLSFEGKINMKFFYDGESPSPEEDALVFLRKTERKEHDPNNLKPSVVEYTNTDDHVASISSILKEITDYIARHAPTRGWKKASLHIVIEGNKLSFNGLLDDQVPFNTPKDSDLPNAILRLRLATRTDNGIWNSAVISITDKGKCTLDYTLE
jgi:hypothetical protein